MQNRQRAQQESERRQLQRDADVAADVAADGDGDPGDGTALGRGFNKDVEEDKDVAPSAAAAAAAACSPKSGYSAAPTSDQPQQPQSSRGDAAPRGGEKINGNEAPAAQNRRRPAENPSLLLNPTFFNNPRIREASIPAANGHFSARSLAHFYQALLKPSSSSSPPSSSSSKTMSFFGARPMTVGGIGAHLATHLRSSPETQTSSSTVSGEGERLLQGGSGKFLLGYMLFDGDATTAATNATTIAEVKLPLGHTGLGGSVAFCDPVNDISIALTLNRLSFDSANTNKIICEVYDSLGLAAPSAFVEKRT